MSDKTLNIKFDRHGLGDCVHFAYAVQLYRARGYSVTVQVEENKKFLWQVSGVNIVQGGDLPDHSYHYPAGFDDLNAPDYSANKVAFGLRNSVMPSLDELGLTEQTAWDELCNVRLSAHEHIPQEAHDEAEKFIEGLPHPIIAIHSRGTNWHERKSIPTEIAFDVILKLLDQTGGSVVVLDFDRRAPMVGDERCKGIKPSWGHIGVDRLCALYDRIDLLIGVDSGPFHVAAMTPVKALGVFRTLHPNRVCLPNPNAVYLASDRYEEHWQSRRDRWNIVTYHGEEPTADDIVEKAIMMINGHSSVQSIDSALQEFCGVYSYDRVGHDLREMELLPDGSIAKGRADCEERWTVRFNGSIPQIAISGRKGLICICSQASDGVFRGRWTKYEQMPIELKFVSRLQCQTTVIQPKDITINVDQGPFVNGIGDAILLTWIASQNVRLFSSQGGKRDALSVLGVTSDVQVGVVVNSSETYSQEQLNQGVIPRLMAVCRTLGIEYRPVRPSVNISSAAVEFAKDYWGNGSVPRILLCPEANDPTRLWPHWDQLQYLLPASCNVKVLRSSDVDGSWAKTAAIMQQASIVVAVDSAPAHMAASVGSTTIVLLGPVSASAYAHAENVTGLAVDASCQSCVGCSYSPPFEEACKQGCSALRKLSPEVVADAVLKKLQPIPVGKPLLYETYAQLAARVRDWCQELPEFVAVAGAPRAGMIVAGMIAAERNIHLVTLDEIREGKTPWKQSLRRNCPAKGDGIVLVVDDTVDTGGHAKDLRASLPEFCRLGVVYAVEKGRQFVDYAACTVTVDHVFEWNWGHHWYCSESLFDMDGVLCEDWRHTSEDGPLTDEYQRHLQDAKLTLKPSFPIGEIVTGRLEKYRERTVAWLAKNGVQYKTLTMHPAASAGGRGAVAEWKAEIFKQRPNARMFIESCSHQAQIIARITARPVLSWPENKILNGAVI